MPSNKGYVAVPELSSKSIDDDRACVLRWSLEVWILAMRIGGAPAGMAHQFMNSGKFAWSLIVLLLQASSKIAVCSGIGLPCLGTMFEASSSLRNV
eukprot:59924-Amphidinium_carterae.1